MQWQGGGHVRERHVALPGYTVVGRLIRVHLVAGSAGTRRLATGCYARRFVVPSGKECACVAGRKVGLPRRLGRVVVAVQLERSAEGHATVGGANVEDIAWADATGAGTATCGIDVANDVVVGGRFTPAHVSPVSRAGVHGGEIAR